MKQSWNDPFSITEANVLTQRFFFPLMAFRIYFKYIFSFGYFFLIVDTIIDVPIPPLYPPSPPSLWPSPYCCLCLWVMHTRKDTKPPRIIGGGGLGVQASPAAWVFQEPICVSVPAGGGVRGYIWLQWILFGRLSVHFPVSWWVVYKCTCRPCWVFSSFSPKVAWAL